MVSQNKMDEALLFCYRELFKQSDPPGDFDKLVDNAPTNERGQKEIPFMDYEIEKDKLDNIIQETIKKYKIPSHRRPMFKASIYLGCSPKTKKED